jgi:hypothetical protein
MQGEDGDASAGVADPGNVHGKIYGAARLKFRKAT